MEAVMAALAFADRPSVRPSVRPTAATATKSGKQEIKNQESRKSGIQEMRKSGNQEGSALPRMAVSYTPTLTTTTTTARAYFQILVPVWVVRPCARVTAHPARGLEGPPPVFPACGGVNAGRRAPGGGCILFCVCVWW